MTIRHIHFASILLSFALAIVLGVLTILRNHNNVYYLLYSVSSFALAAYYVVPVVYTHIIAITFQFIISLLNIISGILLIVHFQYTVVTILFTVNIIFISVSLTMLLFIVYIESNTVKDNVTDTVSKKASDATLFDHDYALDKNWIEKNGTDCQNRMPLPYSMSTNTIQQALQRAKSHDASSLINVDDHYDMLTLPKRVTAQDVNATNKQKMRMQRWRLINDEKQFMSQINESLLPPVLRNSKRVSEDNEKDMQGLEQISGFKPKKIRSTMTLDEWDLSEYNKMRKISGYTIVPGMHHFVSDTNLCKKTLDTNVEHLLPPKESPVDNIDHLSDIETNNIPSLDRDFSYPSNQSECAPSLHTFRKESSNSQNTQLSDDTNQVQTQTISPHPLPEPTTPPPPPSSELMTNSKNNSPIKKFLTDSPRKIFRSNTAVFHQRHNHSNSIASNSYSLMSGVSSRSRSSSPKKLKSYLKIHKHSLSVPNFAINKSSSQQLTSPLPSPQHSEYFSVNSTKLVEPIDLWEVQTTNFAFEDADEQQSLSEPKNEGETNDGSRVSSLPSQAIGEYDREKWRAIKLCQAGKDIGRPCV